MLLHVFASNLINRTRNFRHPLTKMHLWQAPSNIIVYIFFKWEKGMQLKSKSGCNVTGHSICHMHTHSCLVLFFTTRMQSSPPERPNRGILVPPTEKTGQLSLLPSSAEPLFSCSPGCQVQTKNIQCKSHYVFPGS